MDHNSRINKYTKTPPTLASPSRCLGASLFIDCPRRGGKRNHGGIFQGGLEQIPPPAGGGMGGRVLMDLVMFAPTGGGFLVFFKKGSKLSSNLHQP